MKAKSGVMTDWESALENPFHVFEFAQRGVLGAVSREF